MNSPKNLQNFKPDQNYFKTIKQRSLQENSSSALQQSIN